MPARATIFAMTALLYIWNLAQIGMGNDFYAAAVKSGTESWKAFFFGSLDPGSFITVDKPPAALWVMELSGRIFGFSSWSMLLPEALAGVATVMVLYHLVRRWFGEPAAVLASLALALTPVAVVIFRYNDPDAFLTLLLVLAAWAWWRAMETGKTVGLVLGAALVGLAFLTKTLDAFIVVPALGLAYLWCGPPRLGPAHRPARMGHLGPARLQRMVGGHCGAVAQERAAVHRWQHGQLRAQSDLWLQRLRPHLRFGWGRAGRQHVRHVLGLWRRRRPAAHVRQRAGWPDLLALAGRPRGARRRSVVDAPPPRGDHQRAGFVLWGGILLMFLAVYDYAQGIFHPYYTVVMAPAVAALAGAGAVALWRLGRQSLRWAWVLPATVVGTVLWADALLARTSGYDSWLGPTVVATGVIAALILFLCMVRPNRTRWLALGAGVVAAVSVLAGPAAYSLTTVGTTTSAIATAGPASGGSGLAGGRGAGGGTMPGGSATGGPPTGAGTGARRVGVGPAAGSRAAWARRWSVSAAAAAHQRLTIR